jgi:hypothetical protein
MLSAAGLRYLRPFLAAARHTRRTQEKTLRRILAANATTEFGQEHGFARLPTRDAYRAAVPVQTHESLGEAIQRQAETGTPALTASQPVFYARTSGTTGPVRDFPVTGEAITAQRHAQRILAAALFRGSGFFGGQIAGLGGAHIEGRLPSGQPYGSASGQTYATAPRLIRNRFIVPEATFGIADPAAKYHSYALRMLGAADLTGIITANPSTLLSVLAHIRAQTETLLRDLTDGAGISSQPLRARNLEAALAQSQPFAQIWPRLSTLATWTGGNCRVALDQLAPMLRPDLQIAEIGYRASEFVGTINADVSRNLCLPDIRHTVFEFVEEGRWERGAADFLWLDELERGGRYYVFATTQSGLYRYHINDVVEVTGHYGDCPALAFVRKGQGVTSITGEKVSEGQMISAVRQVMQSHGIPPAFFIALADAHSVAYRLYYEANAPGAVDRAAEIAAEIDAVLCKTNIEYAAKRLSGRLSPPSLEFLRPGSGEAVKAAVVASGQREAQVKPPALADAAQWSFDLAPHAWELQT